MITHYYAKKRTYIRAQGKVNTLDAHARSLRVGFVCLYVCQIVS